MKKKNKFKTIVTAVFLLLGMSGAMAQSGGTDGFFNNEDGDYRENGGMTANDFNQTNNGLEAAPLGGGLLILTSLGVIYAATRRKEQK